MCKQNLHFVTCITLIIFTDQTVHIRQMLLDSKLFVMSSGVICKHPANANHDVQTKSWVLIKAM